ncbi:MAG: VWA domain-containing protein [Acidobacteriaceae bacterium]|nr:VWA domain-containing protein [Acidobacteriaceae bacterium]
MKRMGLGLAAVWFWSMTAGAQQGAPVSSAQTPSQQAGTQEVPPSLVVQSSIVFVPTTVQMKDGQVLYGLKANQFVVEADGVPQQATLDTSEEIRPIAMAVVVQCSRAYAFEYPKMAGVATMVEAMLGGGPSQVAVMDFGSEPELITNFTTNATRRERALNSITPCDDDPKAAIYDAVDAANKLFERMDPKGRHVILLLSETRDHGSKTKPQDTIRALGKTDTIVYSLAYSPMRDQMKEDLKSSDGMAGGVIGLIGAAVQALRKNVAKEFARESGGEYLNFGTQNKFDMNLNGLANRVDNYYLLSFHPHFAAGQGEPGAYHRITVRIPEYPSAQIHHRESYWFDVPGQSATEGDAPAQGNEGKPETH